jgi:hypothetical protein
MTTGPTRAQVLLQVGERLGLDFTEIAASESPVIGRADEKATSDCTGSP